MEQTGSDAAKPLGELLRGRGLLNEEQLAYALAQQQQTSRPLGEILVGLGYISVPIMAQALATQRGGVAKTEYGYAVGFQAPSAATTAQLPPPPLTAIAAPAPSLGAALRTVPIAEPAPAEPPVAVAPVEPVAAVAPAPPPVEPVAIETVAVETVAVETVAAAPVAPAATVGFIDLTPQAQTPTPTPVAVEPVGFVDLTPLAQMQAPAPVVAEPADDTLTTELEAAVAARDALAAELAEARNESAAAWDELHALQQELDDVRAQVASREEATVATAKDEADGLRAQLAELRGMADAAAAAESRAAELERTAREAEARSAQSAGQLQALTAERDQLLASAETHSAALERTTREAAEQVQALMTEREQLRGRVEALDQELEAMSRRAADLERTADSLRAELAQRPSTPEPAPQGEKSVLDGRLATLESRLEHAVDMLGVLRGERESVGELERRLATVIGEQRIAEERSALLAAQLEERTRQYELAMAELQRAHAAAVAPEPERVVEQSYLIFATLAGKYEILERVGVVPAAAGDIEIDGATHAIVRVGSLPLAGSDVSCVYTIPAA